MIRKPKPTHLQDDRQKPAMTLADGDFRDIPVAERQRQDDDEGRDERFAKMPTPDLDVVIAQLRQLATADPQTYKAFGLILEWRLKEQLHVQSKRGRRSDLLTRLQAVHTCQRADSPGFTQLQRSSSGPREWRCADCGAIVTLPAGKLFGDQS